MQAHLAHCPVRYDHENVAVHARENVHSHCKQFDVLVRNLTEIFIDQKYGHHKYHAQSTQAKQDPKRKVNAAPPAAHIFPGI